MLEALKSIDILENIEYLKPLFEQSFNPIVITEPNLELPGPKFLYVNSAFTNITGYTLEEIEEKTPRILQGVKTERVVLDELKAKLKKGEFFQGSTINYRKDGSEFWIEWNISPIYDKNGELSCYFCVQHDISIEKNMEEELKRRVEEETTKRIEQEKIALQQAKMAMMGEMIGVIGHQWQQPIANALLQVDMLTAITCDGDEGEKVKELGEKIVEQLMFMSQTIRDFKSFFKVNKLKKHFNVVEEIENVLRLLEPMIKAADMRLELDVGKSITSVYGYPNEFKHVILNIVKNAKDAYEERGLKKGVVYIKISEVEGFAKITISDQAGGIPSELLPEKIFENFASTKGEKGSGIGMSISKSIIETNMEGSLSVRNSEGGAEFTIKIPCKTLSDL